MQDRMDGLILIMKEVLKALGGAIEVIACLRN